MSRTLPILPFLCLCAAAPAKAAEAAPARADEGWIITFSADLAAAPSYPGARTRTAQGVPGFAFRRAGEKEDYSAPDDGLDFSVFDAGWLKAGPVAKLASARAESGNAELHGLRFIDWTLEAGPTWIVPGSHKMRRPPRPGEGHNAGVPILMPKGSVVFFTHGVWHWQGDRTAPGDRVTLHAHFNRGILRSLEPKKTDVQLLHSNSPRLGEMLGEDDWFDKMSAHGRDQVRFAYMHKLHAFTEKQKQVILAVAE